jgi:hypothetical protein
MKMFRAELLSVKADLERELESSSTASSAGSGFTTPAGSACAPATGLTRNRLRMRRRRSRRSGGSAAGSRAGSRSSTGAVLVGMLRETGRARSSAGRVRTARPNEWCRPTRGRDLAPGGPRNLCRDAVRSPHRPAALCVVRVRHRDTDRPARRSSLPPRFERDSGALRQRSRQGGVDGASAGLERGGLREHPLPSSGVLGHDWVLGRGVTPSAVFAN